MKSALGWLAFLALAYLALNVVALGHLEYALGWPTPVDGNSLFMGATVPPR